MIQAFVSLKPQQPPRTESGMRSFFEALQGAVFSQPTIFRTNADVSVRPYTLDSVCEAALNPNCKFVVLRAECEKFWQCTFLLPDKQGMGALFFDLQRQQNPRRLSPESLIEMFKKLYKSLSPRLIRIGDSEAREKLKSRHGLVMMPGLGRIEWLQIVSPEVYSDIYNPSELVAAPGYQTEIWEDGSLFMRVYDDPNDWESEDNISQANFIPGFLAGLAKIKDNEKEKDSLREMERLWSRAEKTAEKAYEVFNAAVGVGSSAPAPSAQTRETQPVQTADLDRLVESSNTHLDAEDARKRAVVFARLKSEYKIEENAIEKVGQEGPCTIFRAQPDKKPAMFVTYQDLERKVFILNVFEDLSRFLSANGCSVKQAHFESIKRLIKTYYHPENQMLNALEDLPSEVSRDRRMPELREQFKPAAVETIKDNQSLTFWYYKPDIQGIETLTLTQYEDWPLQIEAKIQCADMENEPETTPAPAQTAPAASEPKAEAKAEPKAEPAPAPVPAPKHDAAPVAKPAPKAVSAQNMPAIMEGSSYALVKVVLVIVLMIVVVYVALVYFSNGGDWNLLNMLK